MAEDVASEFTVCPLGRSSPLKIESWDLSISAVPTDLPIFRPWPLNLAEKSEAQRSQSAVVRLTAVLSNPTKSIQECALMVVCDDGNAQVDWQDYPTEVEHVVVPRPKDSPWKQKRIKVTYCRLVLNEGEKGKLVCHIRQPYFTKDLAQGCSKVVYLPFRPHQWAGVASGTLKAEAPVDLDLRVEAASAGKSTQDVGQPWSQMLWQRLSQLTQKASEPSHSVSLTKLNPEDFAAGAGGTASEITVKFLSNPEPQMELQLICLPPTLLALILSAILVRRIHNAWLIRLAKLLVLALCLGLWLKVLPNLSLLYRPKPFDWVASYRAILFLGVPLVYWLTSLLLMSGPSRTQTPAETSE